MSEEHSDHSVGDTRKKLSSTNEMTSIKETYVSLDKVRSSHFRAKIRSKCLESIHEISRPLSLSLSLSPPLDTGLSISDCLCWRALAELLSVWTDFCPFGTVLIKKFRVTSESEVSWNF